MLTLLAPAPLARHFVNTPLVKDAPLAPVRHLAKTSEWEVIRCPYCAGVHHHAAARSLGASMPMLGGRVAHCHPGGDRFAGYPGTSEWEYRLVAIDGDPSREELDAHFPLVDVAIAVAWLEEDAASSGIAFDRSGAKARVVTSDDGIALTQASNWLPSRAKALLPMMGNPNPKSRGLRISIVGDHRDAVWAKTDGRCWYCGIQTSPFTTFCVDHVVPISSGGKNTLPNLVPSCRTCNGSKGALALELFRKKRGGGLFWAEEREREDWT